MSIGVLVLSQCIKTRLTVDSLIFRSLAIDFGVNPFEWIMS